MCSIAIVVGFTATSITTTAITERKHTEIHIMKLNIIWKECVFLWPFKQNNENICKVKKTKQRLGEREIFLLFFCKDAKVFFRILNGNVWRTGKKKCTRIMGIDVTHKTDDLHQASFLYHISTSIQRVSRIAFS